MTLPPLARGQQKLLLVLGDHWLFHCHSSYWLALGTMATLASGLSNAFVPCLLQRTGWPKTARGGGAYAGQGGVC